MNQNSGQTQNPFWRAVNAALAVTDTKEDQAKMDELGVAMAALDERSQMQVFWIVAAWYCGVVPNKTASEPALYAAAIKNHRVSFAHTAKAWKQAREAASLRLTDMAELGLLTTRGKKEHFAPVFNKNVLKSAGEALLKQGHHDAAIFLLDCVASLERARHTREQEEAKAVIRRKREEEEVVTTASESEAQPGAKAGGCEDSRVAETSPPLPKKKASRSVVDVCARARKVVCVSSGAQFSFWNVVTDGADSPNVYLPHKLLREAGIEDLPREGATAKMRFGVRSDDASKRVAVAIKDFLNVSATAAAPASESEAEQTAEAPQPESKQVEQTAGSNGGGNGNGSGNGSDTVDVAAAITVCTGDGPLAEKLREAAATKAAVSSEESS